MIANEYFRKAEQCENVVSEIYVHLAGVFERDAATAKLFKQLAEEEIQHAARVHMLGSRNLQAGTGLPQHAAKLPDVDAALAFIQGELRDLRAGKWAPDQDAVLRRAMALEERLAVFHAEAMTVFVRPELQSFFSTLRLQDRQHRELLNGALKKKARI